MIVFLREFSWVITKPDIKYSDRNDSGMRSDGEDENVDDIIPLDSDMVNFGEIRDTSPQRGSGTELLAVSMDHSTPRENVTGHGQRSPQEHLNTPQIKTEPAFDQFNDPLLGTKDTYMPILGDRFTKKTSYSLPSITNVRVLNVKTEPSEVTLTPTAKQIFNQPMKFEDFSGTSMDQWGRFREFDLDSLVTIVTRKDNFSVSSCDSDDIESLVNCINKNPGKTSSRGSNSSGSNSSKTAVGLKLTDFDSSSTFQGKSTRKRDSVSLEALKAKFNIKDCSVRLDKEINCSTRTSNTEHSTSEVNAKEILNTEATTLDGNNSKILNIEETDLESDMNKLSNTETTGFQSDSHDKYDKSNSIKESNIVGRGPISKRGGKAGNQMTRDQPLQTTGLLSTMETVDTAHSHDGETKERSTIVNGLKRKIGPKSVVGKRNSPTSPKRSKFILDPKMKTLTLKLTKVVAKPGSSIKVPVNNDISQRKTEEIASNASQQDTPAENLRPDKNTQQVVLGENIKSLEQDKGDVSSEKDQDIVDVELENQDNCSFLENEEHVSHDHVMDESHDNIMDNEMSCDSTSTNDKGRQLGKTRQKDSLQGASEDGMKRKNEVNEIEDVKKKRLSWNGTKLVEKPILSQREKMCLPKDGDEEIQMFGTIRCKICKIKLNTKFLLETHMRDYHKLNDNIEDMNCKECNKTFNTMICLNAHVQTHKERTNHVMKDKSVHRKETSKDEKHSEESKTQKDCSESHGVSTKVGEASKKKDLKKDGKKEAKSMYRCLLCKETFDNNIEYVEHIKTHKKQRCEICDEVFHDKILLAKHMKNHCKTQCRICDRYFKSRKELEKHSKEHSKTEHLNKHKDVKRTSENSTKNDVKETFKEGKRINKKDETLKDGKPKSNEKETLKEGKTKSDTNAALKDGNILNRDKNETKSNQNETINEDKSASRSPEKSLVENKSDDSNAVQTEKVLFPCIKCPEVFRSKEECEEHMNTHENQSDLLKGKTIFPCTKCSGLFMKREDLVKHVKVHNDEIVTFKCDRCSEEYGREEDLIEHKKEKHVDPKKCSVCFLLFDTEKEFQEHEKTHDKDSRYKCDLCFKCFNIPIEFEIHREKAHGIFNKECAKCHKTFTSKSQFESHQSTKCPPNKKCQVCGKTFNRKNDLAIHMASHRKKSDIECAVCQKKFASLNELEGHKVEHELKECSVCFKKFRTQKVVNEHMKVHYGKNCQQCKICGQCFPTGKKLIDHEKKEHPESSDPNAEVYTCDTCQDVYKYFNDLQKHLESHKVVILECETCKKEFSDENQLSKHVRDKHNKGMDYRCGQCKLPFKTEKELTQHVADFHDRVEYTCGICDKTFHSEKRLTEHMLSHQGQFECGICQQTFTEETDLITHIKEHTSGAENLSNKESEESLANKKSNTQLVSGSSLANKESEKQNMCKTCEKTFPSEKEMRKHAESCKVAEEFQCGNCKKSFTSNNELLEHMTSHANNNRLKSNNKIQTSKDNLKTPDEYQCGICKTFFSSEMTLTQHIMSHASSPAFSCQTCGEVFKSKGEFDKHNISHGKDKQKTFKCGVCSYVGLTRNLLLKHLEGHL